MAAAQCGLGPGIVRHVNLAASNPELGGEGEEILAGAGEYVKPWVTSPWDLSGILDQEISSGYSGSVGGAGSSGSTNPPIHML